VGAALSSVAKIARILNAFASERTDLSVTDAGLLLDCPKSTASRLLKSMADAGLLDHAPARRYRLGALLVGLGRAGAPSRLVERLHAMLGEVVRDCGHTGYVSVRDGLEIYGLRMIEGAHDLRVAREPGVRMPATATAVGRALLARLDDAALLALLPERLDPPSPAAPASRAEAMARIAQARAQGWAEAADEGHRGIGTIAVAVADPATGEAASACITYPAAVVGAAERDHIRGLLIDGARRVGAELADPAWTAAPPSARRRSFA
jgi:DNA-binding IclR family transcriptional regulator